MPKEKSRKPDYVLKVMNKGTGQKSGRIGGAWANGDGSISLIMDFPNTVQNDPSGLLVYTLFPNNQDPE
jgi:hypothetical protein